MEGRGLHWLVPPSRRRKGRIPGAVAGPRVGYAPLLVRNQMPAQGIPRSVVPGRPAGRGVIYRSPRDGLWWARKD